MKQRQSTLEHYLNLFLADVPTIWFMLWSTELEPTKTIEKLEIHKLKIAEILDP